MKIAAWNVNSLRARLDRVTAWLDANRPDVVCLQELKGTEESLDFSPLEALGYHRAVHGQPTYNGVAILSLEEPTDVITGMAPESTGPEGDEDEQARLISATVGGIRFFSAYCPNGGETGSDKWRYKLDWFERLLVYLDRLASPDDPLVIAGDFNVARDARDVENPDRWADSVLYHPEIRRVFERLLEWGFEDTYRLHHEEGGAYTWWDYRRLAFPKNDGLRIDYILATRPVAERCTGASIDRDERKGEKPSDHAPVLAELDG